MDSVTQFVLGAAVGSAVLVPRVPAWRSLLWCGVIATLPDLDVFVDHGDPVSNMVLHRGASHALCYHTLLAPLLGAAIAWLHRERALRWRWIAAAWLALVTHALLDAMTIYGTRLALPFSEHPFGVGSLFVIDPAYTLPLVIGTVWLWLSRGSVRGRRANWLGLALSTCYAIWSVVAQQMATSAAERALAARGIQHDGLLVTAAPVQTLVWRILAKTPTHVHEGFWSFADGERLPAFTAIDVGRPWLDALRTVPAAATLLQFADGWCKVERGGDVLRLVDLRMGQEPHYVFAFAVARVGVEGNVIAETPQRLEGSRVDVRRGLAWLWARLGGDDVPTPR